jgi:monovalent cation:H+ antiporter-2, CPA2 family
MTLAELAATFAVLGVLGLIASRFGLSAIPAYLAAGILLGPNEPELFSLVEPSEVTEFVAELGLIALLFFLGLEFSFDRVVGTTRHIGLGGTIDLLVNFGLGLVVGLAAFGPSVGALVLAAAIYVSSSAVTVKGLIDFRRLADDETDLVLAILVFEDLAIAFMLGFAGGGGGEVGPTLALIGKVLGFIGLALAASRWLPRLLDRVLERLPREFFLLAVFAFLVAMAAAGKALGLSEAIGALLAGIVLAGTDARDEIEERFFSFRDLFGALFFFVFGLAIDLGQFGRVGWMLLLAVPLTIVGKALAGYLAGRVGGFTDRQSLNAGLALVAHGEFTIILAEVAARNADIPAEVRGDIVAFAGLYVLATATLGVLLMKESKRLGRAVFPLRRLGREGVP